MDIVENLFAFFFAQDYRIAIYSPALDKDASLFLVSRTDTTFTQDCSPEAMAPAVSGATKARESTQTDSPGKQLL